MGIYLFKDKFYVVNSAGRISNCRT